MPQDQQDRRRRPLVAMHSHALALAFRQRPYDTTSANSMSAYARLSRSGAVKPEARMRILAGFDL